MTTVVVTGAAGDLGRRVLVLAAADPSVERLVAVDRVEVPGRPPRAEVVRADLATADLKDLFHGADTVVHLAATAQSPDDDRDTVDDVAVARRVLDAASSTGVQHLIVRSSATVYGAWANNPVPLTEEAPLRPEPRLPWATERAEIERLVGEWRAENPGATATVLRPAVTVAEHTTLWLAEALRATTFIRAGDDDDPPFQFLHLDDLAAAVDLCRRERLDGPVNVAPDGWVPGDTVRALAGGGPRLRLPEPLATRIAAWRWRTRLAPTPPGLVPYTVHPWVVSNDRLEAAGWEPAFSNEEAYVVGHEASPWADLSPRRRQELALGVAGGAILLAIVGALLGWRRSRRR